ncbi:MAG: acetolactate synthase small subunit [Chloroflexi bacterium]|nr:acetolactate synthase small subunit [Chloroflexota bacterium]MQF86125.1 acetolactate synthase small subunit [SAR202 cluster bacterium]
MDLSHNFQRHTISALVTDKPGVLARVAGLFSRRGFNISNLSVGRSESTGFSRMTFVVEGDEWVVEQVTKQLYKLIDVIRVSDLSEESIVVRELAFIKVKSDSSNSAQIIEIAESFRANIVDIGKESLIIEVTGDDGKVDLLLDSLKPFGVRETMRTGRIAMTRGSVTTGMRKTSSAADQSAPDAEVVP